MKQEEIDFFNRMAPHWDESEVNSTPERIDAILSLMDWHAGMHVLDLGTGTGVLIPYLTGRGASVTAVDASDGMLARARMKYGGMCDVEFLMSDFENEPLCGRFDRVMLYCVYPHLHHPEATLCSLFKNNVTDDGDVIIAFPSDERYINNIHSERKAESDMLPPASVLAQRICSWGMQAEVLAADCDAYVVRVSGGNRRAATFCDRAT